MTTKQDALTATYEIGARVGEMTRDFFDLESRVDDGEYLLLRMETLLDYTDGLTRENADLIEANRILADTVDTLIEALLDALEVGRG